MEWKIRIKMKKILFLGVFVIGFSPLLWSQNTAEKEEKHSKNPRVQMPWGVNLSYSGMIVGCEVETIGVSYFILPQIELDADLGTVDYKQAIFTVGTKIHANRNRSKCGLTPFSGLTLGIFQNEGGILKVPVGLNYLSKFGLNMSSSLGVIFATSGYGDIFLEFKLGWRF